MKQKKTRKSNAQLHSEAVAFVKDATVDQLVDALQGKPKLFLGDEKNLKGLRKTFGGPMGDSVRWLFRTRLETLEKLCGLRPRTATYQPAFDECLGKTMHSILKPLDGKIVCAISYDSGFVEATLK
jgi:hypothetical protein